MLDRRTTTAVESLLSLGGSPSPVATCTGDAQTDTQWRPPSPAPSVASALDSQVLSPPRVVNEEIVVETESTSVPYSPNFPPVTQVGIVSQSPIIL